jgi:arginase
MGMRVHIVAVPFDTALRGWRMGAGPEHLLACGLVARLEAQGDAVTTAIASPRRGAAAEIATAFELMSIVAREVRSAVGQGAFPLVLSGNCCTASGTLSGLTPARRAIAWFDAHGDANTPDTTTTGFLDGTALATAMGWCWNGLAAQIPGFDAVDPRHVLLLGARDLDPDEAVLLDRGRVCRLSPAETAGAPLDAALSALPRDLQAYVHCDLDALDPSVGQANVFPVPGGFEVDAITGAIARLGRSVPIAAAAVTAYAPAFDAGGRVCLAAFQIIDAIVGAVRLSRDAGASRADAARNAPGRD